MNLFCRTLVFGFLKRRKMYLLSAICVLLKNSFNPIYLGVVLVFRQGSPFSACISHGYQTFLPFTDKSSLVHAQKCPQRKERILGRKRPSFYHLTSHAL